MLFTFLQSARESYLGFKGSGTHRTVLTQDKVFVIVIVVVGTTTIVSAREGERPLTGEVHLNDGIDDQQCRVAIVTLHVQVVQVGSTIDVWLQILVLIAPPGSETEVLGIEDEASVLTEIQLRLRLDAESAAHVVVALNDVEVVTLGATQ